MSKPAWSWDDIPGLDPETRKIARHSVNLPREPARVPRTAPAVRKDAHDNCIRHLADNGFKCTAIAQVLHLDDDLVRQRIKAMTLGV